VNATDPITRNGVIGYRAAKLLCEKADGCASPTAHMCSAGEMVRSAQLGMFAAGLRTSAWVSTGAAYPTGSAFSSADCGGWGTSNGAQTGTAFHASQGGIVAMQVSCDQSAAIACCR
jgi:hypothetical protein